jgi:hypothetical protein
MGFLDWIRHRQSDCPDDTKPAGPLPRQEAGEPGIERDLSGQVLEIDISAPRGPFWERSIGPPPIAPSLAQLDNGSEMVSAAVLIQKAKQFDDGLYSTVELAALHGCGDRPAKTAWLAELRSALGMDQAATPLYAAAQMLDPDVAVPVPLTDPVARRAKKFLEDELSSKPVSFYTWSLELAALFRHDRLLQRKLDAGELGRLISALHEEPGIRAEYEHYLGLIEHLTNRLTEDVVRRGLRALDEKIEPMLVDSSLFPASVSHETELGKKLYGDTAIPDGFDLMGEFVERVQSGSIDLEPIANSGWYDHQVWSLESLVVPHKTAEAKRLRFTSDYRIHLADLFKGALALARETHIKQAEGILIGATFRPREKPSLVVQPDLTCEPLPTHYRRRANSYRFVREVIVDHFGTDALLSMHRQTADGAVDSNLSEELTFMTDLFDGAASTCQREIGASTAKPGETDAVFANWDCSRDPDLGSDVRMMVPVFYDVERKRTKVWAMLGWSERDLSVAFEQPPSITVRSESGEDITARYDIEFDKRRYTIAYPEFAEVYVDRILDRSEFRALCDQYGTREKILAAL